MKVTFRYERGYGDVVTEVVEYNADEFDGMSQGEINGQIDKDLKNWVWEIVGDRISWEPESDAN